MLNLITKILLLMLLLSTTIVTLTTLILNILEYKQYKRFDDTMYKLLQDIETTKEGDISEQDQ